MPSIMHDDGCSSETASVRSAHEDADRIITNENTTKTCSLDSSDGTKGDLEMVISVYCNHLERYNAVEKHIWLSCGLPCGQSHYYYYQDRTWNWLTRLKTNCIRSMDQIKDQKQLEEKLEKLEIQFVRCVQP